jgi:di/tricarboxylate transporter
MSEYLTVAAVTYFICYVAAAYNDEVESDLLLFADRIVRSLLWPLLIISSIGIVVGTVLKRTGRRP